jgi:hypothetical protein
MKRTIIAVTLLLPVGLLTGCNSQQAQPTATQQTASQQEVAPTPFANQSSAETPTPVPVSFKTDPKNLLPVFTPLQLSLALLERHGTDKLRGKTIRIKATLETNSLGNVISLMVEPEPLYFDFFEIDGFGDSVLDSLHKGDDVEIICVFTGLAKSVDGSMHWVLKGKELHKSE